MDNNTKEIAKDVLSTTGRAAKRVAVGILAVTFGTLKYISQTVLDHLEPVYEKDSKKKG